MEGLTKKNAVFAGFSLKISIHWGERIRNKNFSSSQLGSRDFRRCAWSYLQSSQLFLHHIQRLILFLCGSRRSETLTQLLGERTHFSLQLWIPRVELAQLLPIDIYQKKKTNVLALQVELLWCTYQHYTLKKVMMYLICQNKINGFWWAILWWYRYPPPSL